MTDLCMRLSDWALSRGWNDLSTAAQERVRQLFVDTLGCALHGRLHPAATQASIVAARLSGAPTSTGLGSGARLSALAAILDSGAAIRALDFNDFYWSSGSGGHPSDIFAIAIAVAEEADASLQDMLAAVADGYEVYTRLLDLMESGSQNTPFPWDHTSACALASVVIAGRLLRLDRTHMAEAMAVAAAEAPVLSAFRAGKISSAKAVAPALSQINALMAVRLAEVGMTGPREVIAGSRGLAAIVVPGSNLDHLLPSSQDRARVLDIIIKRYPCMGTGQAATAAAIELHGRMGGRVSEISSLTIRLTDSGITRRQTAEVYRRPDRRETADHSFYAIVAVALADGRLEKAQFDGSRWTDPDVAAILDKITLVPDLPGASEGVFSAIATAELADGERVVAEVLYAPGHRLNPLSESEVVAKFKSCSEDVIGAAATAALLGAVAEPNITVRQIMAFIPPR